MTLIGWLQIAIFTVLVLALARPVGDFVFRVMEGPARPLPRSLGRLESWLYRLCGVDPASEQSWSAYAGALLAFSAVSLVATYAIERLQHLLPLNPDGLAAVPAIGALNTAASFTTNTNWQWYAGESTMSHLTQMAGLAWHNFVSAAAGIAVARALARGLTRPAALDGSRTIGNFWADLIRSTLYLLLPACLLLALLFVSQGAIQSFSPTREIATLEGGVQKLPMGPVASQEVIKQLGTNGGGFFNANSAHPFENPTPFINLLQMLLIFVIPAGLTQTFGRMTGDRRQGWSILAAMALLFLLGAGVVYHAESQPNPALGGLGVSGEPGNLEGKEVRFGIAATSLFATVTTAASCGAVNGLHASFNPLGGLVPLVNILLGEVVFGGVGAGLYGILVFVLLSVFIAGLMVGRTPEYLGKKIEAREMQLAVICVLVFPVLILGLAAWAAVSPLALPSLRNAGPHGLSEILYAFASGTANNGSAFAGLDASRPWWNLTLAFAMLAGRFWMIVPVLAIAGSMAGKKTVAPGPGTFPTNTPLFAALLAAVVVIVGALTFFPALSLGPVVEHLLAGSGRTF